MNIFGKIYLHGEYYTLHEEKNLLKGSVRMINVTTIVTEVRLTMINILWIGDRIILQHNGSHV